MTGRDEIDEATLHALVDGELSPERAAEVEAALATRPELLAKVETWRAQRAALKAALDPVLSETPPRRLRALGARPRVNLAMLSRMAAGLALLAVGAGAGYAVKPGGAAAPGPMAQAFGAHAVYAVDARHPIEVSADERDHLNAWLSNRLGRRIAAPDLSESGFSLLGGRLLAANDRPAALFMYQNAQGERATLLMMAPKQAPALGRDGFAVERRGPLSAVAWARDGLETVLIGARPPEVLERAARSISTL